VKEEIPVDRDIKMRSIFYNDEDDGNNQITE
jgi:hypothetical protein